MKITPLSHVWGRRELSRTLEIRWDDNVLYLRITSNVDALLRGLRAHSASRATRELTPYAFNQDDEMEKT